MICRRNTAVSFPSPNKKQKDPHTDPSVLNVASSGRFELPAPRLGGECSIQLSYEDMAEAKAPACGAAGMFTPAPRATLLL